MKKKYTRWLLVLLLLVLAAVAVTWYLFTLKYEDTASVKTDYKVNSLDFLKEFKTDIKAANARYSEKIIEVNGTVSEIEMADTTANIKMVDTTSGSYIIFAFQNQHLGEAKKLKPGEQVTIKGSCSNGAYSAILETEYVTFKRCALN